MRILLIEDDRLLGEGIFSRLRQNGYKPSWVHDVLAAQKALQAESFAALVLDLSLPAQGGVDMLRHLRSVSSELPILALAAKPNEQDIIAGLVVGASDCLLKPFDLAEVPARMNSLVRRAARSGAPSIEYGSLRLDPAECRVEYEGRKVDISVYEFAVLYELILHAGKVMTRAKLQSRLYGWGDDIESNTLEVYVHHLRRKIAPGLILTKRGIGYIIPKISEAMPA
ncbi:MAG: response regulator transcription factor [Betaproteobacteria bacterium]|nr:response regulator transcription factor [Betaproteobacteria bacterium]